MGSYELSISQNISVSGQDTQIQHSINNIISITLNMNQFYLTQYSNGTRAQAVLSTAEAHNTSDLTYLQLNDIRKYKQQF